MKNFLGVIAIVLVFVAYVPYVRDMLKGKTKPHIYSWFVWGLLAMLVGTIQIKNGAGIGALVTLAAGASSVLVFLLGLKNGKKDITKLDSLFLGAALAATIVWLFAKQPLTSMILLVTIGTLGFMPTLRKAWNKPGEETLMLWGINTGRHALGIAAIAKYNAVTLLHPVVWLVINLVFTLILIARRRALTAPKTTP